MFVAGNAGLGKAADKLVRGQDRAPTDLFDKVVAAPLDARVKSTVAAQQLSVRLATRVWRWASPAACCSCWGCWALSHQSAASCQHLAALRSVSQRLAQRRCRRLV